MKVVLKEIEMIASFDKDGNVKPERFRLEAENEELLVITIDNILSVQEQNDNRKKIKVYECQSKINNIMKQYVIKFELGTCTWTLFKW